MRRSSTTPLVRPLAAALLAFVFVLVLAGCGDDSSEESSTDAGSSADVDASDDGTEDGSAPADDTETTDSTAAADEDGSTSAPDDSDGSTTSTPDTTDPVAPEDLPGEEIDIYPYEGASLSVVGVADGDTLNVRSGPGTDFDVVVELDPVTHDLTATGSNRILDDDSLWSEIDVEGATGWANGAFLAQLGTTTSITDAVVIADEGATSVDIAREVAGQRAAAGDGPEPTVTVVQDGDVAIVDVLGYADDAQRGERIEVRGGGGGPVTVTSNALCARGVSDGLCA